MDLPHPATSDANLLPYSSGDRPAIDAEHLEFLSIYHYIVGGLTVMMSCMFMAVIVMGMDMLDNAEFTSDNRGWIVIWAGIAGIILGWIIALLLILVGYHIAKRRHRRFTLFMAAIDFLLFPFGTLLAIFTFIVLRRDSIKLLYTTTAAKKGSGTFSELEENADDAGE